MHRDTNLVQADPRKNRTLITILDRLCQELDLTDTQYETAKQRYGAIGEWLAAGSSPHLKRSAIYAHGSIGLGTAIKPIGGNEFDVDLMCHLPLVGAGASPAQVKALVGVRLREHTGYREMLEEKPRCWRINYANEFHLDISPSIPNIECQSGGELVPDKKLAAWKPTNPTGYMNRFEAYAKLRPVFQLMETRDSVAKANVEPFPEQSTSKPLLKRIVQLLKRHRDYEFLETPRAELAPISIIITTLASRAYAKCVRERVFTDPFDLLVSVVVQMPTFIQIAEVNGRRIFIIENETTTGENFAEKWNHDERLASAFFDWHQRASMALTVLPTIAGLDAVGKHLTESFGIPAASTARAISPLTDSIGAARTAGSLFIAPGLGLATAPSHGAVVVRPNTFFGR